MEEKKERRRKALNVHSAGEAKEQDSSQNPLYKEVH